MGIELGDGGINSDWQVVITLNADKDSEYADYVTDLIENLFGIDASTRIRDKNTLKISCSSISLVEFLISKGAVKGNKIKQKIDILEWIIKNKEYKKAFVRGLVDTDGCLFIHKHNVKGKSYKNIGFCFTSWSLNLLKSVANVMEEYGITPHITDKGRRIYLYKTESIVKYLSVFGSSNPRIINLFNEWRGA